MITPISGAGHVASVEPLAPTGKASAKDEFASLLRSAIDRVEGRGQAAAQAVDSFLSGEGGELHSAILETQRASLEFEMFLQVRNKVVQAYQEIMRMQV